MQTEIKCPYCNKPCSLDVDTIDLDTRYDAIECDCGEAFMVKTTILINFEILTVLKPGTDKDWKWKREAIRLLEKLKNQIEL